MTSLMTYGWAETFEEHQACGGSGKKIRPEGGVNLMGVFGMCGGSGFPIEYG